MTAKKVKENSEKQVFEKIDLKLTNEVFGTNRIMAIDYKKEGRQNSISSQEVKSKKKTITCAIK